MVINQYEIHWINLNPTIGSEIKKIRPCVIISPDEMNHNINTVLIAPLTSNHRRYPTRIQIKFENRIGWVSLDQIKCVDKKRLVKFGAVLNKEYIQPIKTAIREMLVD